MRKTGISWEIIRRVIIYSYPLIGDGRSVLRVPLNYYIPGHVLITLAHAAAHKAHISQRKLMFPLEHMCLNAGGAKVPLSWNNIRWNT